MAQARYWLWGLLALLPLGIATWLVEHARHLKDATMPTGSHLMVLLWGWLFAAVVLGIAVGAATWQRARLRWTDRPVHVALIVLAVFFLLAIAGWPSGRLSHGLDVALMLIAAYALGCVVGWGLRDLAEEPALPGATRALAETRGSAAHPDWTIIEPSPFGRPAYLTRPGREPFFVPGTGIVDPRAATAALAARDAAAGIVRPPPVSPPVSVSGGSAAERPPYLSKPGREPFYLPGAGVTDHRTATALQPVWRGDPAREVSPASASIAPTPAVEAPASVSPVVEPPAVSPTPTLVESPPPSVPEAPALVAAQPDAPLVSPTQAPVAPPPAAKTLFEEPPVVAAPVVAPPVVAPPVVAAPVVAAPVVAPPVVAAPVVAPPVAPSPVVVAPEAVVPAIAQPESVAPEPAPSPPVLNEDRHPGARPPGLVSARDDTADRLQRIKGIGPQNEVRLNALGVWHFAQIAEWTPAHVTWIGSYLAFPGRIEREQWIEQAAVLASGGAGTKDNPVPRVRRTRI